MAGIAIGVVFGAAQLFLLIRGVFSLKTGKIKVLPMLLQFLCPIVGLLLCAFTAREQLLSCAYTIICVLIVGSVIAALLNRRKRDK